jgi:hypothetical protein
VEKKLNSHLCQGSNLASVMMALRLARSFAGADVETVVAGASYAETPAVSAACEVDVHAAVEVYTAHK